MLDNNFGRRKIDVVVLMAGEGRRMRPLTNDCPKALLSCEDGKSILAHIVYAFSIMDCDLTFYTVIGHGINKAHEAINQLRHNVRIIPVYNPFYNTSGPMISLWLGLMQTQSDNVIVVNGDTLLTMGLTEEIKFWMELNDDKVVGLCASKETVFDKEDLKVLVDQHGSFLKVGKELAPEKDSLKSAGVLCMRGGKEIQKIKEMTNQVVMQKEALANKYYWHNLVNLISQNLEVDLIEVSVDSWFEVDTLFDFSNLKQDQ